VLVEVFVRPDLLLLVTRTLEVQKSDYFDEILA